MSKLTKVLSNCAANPLVQKLVDNLEADKSFSTLNEENWTFSRS